MKDLVKLEQNIGVKFKNQDGLIQAIVHRSYINEHPEFKLDHNERLEFLGDAVLELIVTEYLYDKYPNPEGELTNWRASLVNGDNLAKISKNLEIDEFLMMSKGESRDKNSKARQYILANALEAIIGAIYLDQGLKIAKKFITLNILRDLEEIIAKKLYIDAKSDFQEKAQEKIGITPTYKILASAGPDHAKVFKVGVYLSKKLIATGTGTSKQEAQTEAAKKALKNKNWNN
ncbi:MAG: ribonuclease III [Candidatus Buchananbacteria bacterium RIFCSPHIGHO2_02_FULL_40_13]|uniref:Ribonuclease 3 n=1 Tax=Candidatus Buchananbacteria bacterium RIFCSPLOWO2_01_FULL_39_33 TaxID=1797543 RepID=A0A1G1YIR4_9BACT|nr:MAG: ribonuclease III [Candidatus Buchananbacteria bacterium RIFCSPHIGHO2_01_FULL_40_35]OGY49501.1 MAG: ribonuclease III [Candidatus Buchananbacteria bacterium RIFCSPHIGHO2_02_FULL_40_13]OGY51716.1 MAG: ribonuclease III [Candidatus Buchananbacteria bacterium RIFCSPLOWO2_01_FULL_39_33]